MFTKEQIHEAADLLAEAARDLVDETSAQSIRSIERWICEAIEIEETNTERIES